MQYQLLTSTIYAFETNLKENLSTSTLEIYFIININFSTSNIQYATSRKAQ
jgi:hypothetical protein